MSELRNQAALVIDFENFSSGLENAPVDSHSGALIRNVFDYLSDHYGRLVQKMAFADWTNPKLRRYSSELMRQGVQMRHIGRLGFNRVPIESYMLVDSMKLIAENPSVDTFILFSGNADLLPLVLHLRATGHQVIILGATGTIATVLMQNADESLAYDGANILPLETPVYSSQENDDNQESDSGSWGWNGGRTNFVEEKRTRSEYLSLATIQNMSLSEYLHATRWYIDDGITREEILTSIYNIFASGTEGMTADSLRAQIPQAQNVDDRAWQGTIYSLVYGYCLHESRDFTGMSGVMRRLSLDNRITSLDDFMRGYYCSLFHKASQERTDLNAESMVTLMHLDSVAEHQALFASVEEELKNGRR